MATNLRAPVRQVFNQPGQLCGDRPRIAKFAQCLESLPPDSAIFILQRLEQRFDRPGIAEVA